MTDREYIVAFGKSSTDVDIRKRIHRCGDCPHHDEDGINRNDMYPCEKLNIYTRADFYCGFGEEH